MHPADLILHCALGAGDGEIARNLQCLAAIDVLQLMPSRPAQPAREEHAQPGDQRQRLSQLLVWQARFDVDHCDIPLTHAGMAETATAALAVFESIHHLQGCAHDRYQQ